MKNTDRKIYILVEINGKASFSLSVSRGTFGGEILTILTAVVKVSEKICLVKVLGYLLKLRCGQLRVYCLRKV